MLWDFVDATWIKEWIVCLLATRAADVVFLFLVSTAFITETFTQKQFLLVPLTLTWSASILTVRALLGTGSQQELGHGYIIGHDSDIEGQEALAVWSVEVQLLQTVLGQ